MTMHFGSTLCTMLCNLQQVLLRLRNPSFISLIMHATLSLHLQELVGCIIKNTVLFCLRLLLCQPPQELHRLLMCWRTYLH